jgi:hypothetical protein
MLNASFLFAVPSALLTTAASPDKSDAPHCDVIERHNISSEPERLARQIDRNFSNTAYGADDATPDEGKCFARIDDKKTSLKQNIKSDKAAPQFQRLPSFLTCPLT